MKSVISGRGFGIGFTAPQHKQTLHELHRTVSATGIITATILETEENCSIEINMKINCRHISWIEGKVRIYGPFGFKAHLE
jgi:hypothetical protein